MFDLAWSEIGLIVAVAVIVIGPKDLPDAIRTVARGVGKLRRMAGEFQGHLDEVVREAKLEDVRDQIRDIRNFDIKGEIEKAVDQDGKIRDTFRDDPFRAAPTTPSSDTAPAMPVTPVGEAAIPPVDATGAADPAPPGLAEAAPGTGPSAPSHAAVSPPVTARGELEATGAEVAAAMPTGSDLAPPVVSDAPSGASAPADAAALPARPGPPRATV